MNSSLWARTENTKPPKQHEPVPRSTGLLGAKETSTLPIQNRLILVVDDFQDDREMYAQFLSLKGFRVEIASDGEDALSKAFQLQPDLILMDLWMPEISGWEAIRQLKQDEKTRAIPIVVLTARAFVSARAIGSESCLTKPCSPGEMLAEVNRLLNT